MASTAERTPYLARFPEHYTGDAWALALTAIHERRAALVAAAPAMLAGAGVTLLSIAGGRFGSFPFFIGWTTLAASFAFALMLHRRQRVRTPAFVAMLLLALSAWGAVYGSHRWGAGNWVIFAAIAIWMTPFLAFGLVRLRVHAVALSLVPGALAHSSVIYYQALVHEMPRATGLMQTANVAAGFLAIAIAATLPTRLRWLAILLIPPLALTGSRWGMAVGLTATALAIVRYRAWPMLVCAGALVVLSALWPVRGVMVEGLVHYHVDASYVRDMRSESPAASLPEKALIRMKALAMSVRDRLSLPRMPHLLPKGDVGRAGPPHSAPLRAATEYGVLAGLAWVALSLRALKRGQGMWVVGVVLALGMLDYYVWVGPLGWAWWLVVGAGGASEAGRADGWRGAASDGPLVTLARHETV